MIFADEPTGNLDSRTGGEILAFMRYAVDELGQTIVMVTHDASAARYADTVLFLADGNPKPRHPHRLRHAGHRVPGAPIDARRVHANEDIAVADGGPRGLAESQHVLGRAAISSWTMAVIVSTPERECFSDKDDMTGLLRAGGRGTVVGRHSKVGRAGPPERPPTS